MLSWSEPIPRVRSPSARQFLLEFVAPARPVIIEGALAHWPALEQWTFDRLRQRCGQRLVTTYRVKKGELHFDERTGIIPESLPLAVVLDELARADAPEHRIRSVIERELPELLGDVDVPAFCPPRMFIETNLWISGPETRSRLHFDQPHNVLAQVLGDKRVLIIPARERRFVYPHSWRSAVAQFSRVDVHAPDLLQFPMFRRTHPLEGELHPGDALFIPSSAWHYIEGDARTISVGFRWSPWTRLPLVFAADLYKRWRRITR